MGAHPLTAVLPLLRDTLIAVADEYRMVVTDTQGRVVGEDGREHRLTSAAAPIHDPETGAVMGAVDVTGQAGTFHPTTLALVVAAARLAEGLPAPLSWRCVNRRVGCSARRPAPPGGLSDEQVAAGHLVDGDPEAFAAPAAGAAARSRTKRSSRRGEEPDGQVGPRRRPAAARTACRTAANCRRERFGADVGGHVVEERLDVVRVVLEAATAASAYAANPASSSPRRGGRRPPRLCPRATELGYHPMPSTRPVRAAPTHRV